MSTPSKFSEEATRELQAVVCKTCGQAVRCAEVPEQCPKCGADIGHFSAPVRLVYRVESMQPPRPHVWLETETRGNLVKV